MRKGQILVNAGEVSEHVYMVFTGEVIIQHKNLKQYTTTDMLRIGPTGSFGEEGVLEGKPFKHNIVCCNDNTTIYKISKDDLIRNFPSYLVNEIKKNLQAKQSHHENLLELQRIPQKENMFRPPRQAFPYASPFAQKTLSASQTRKHASENSYNPTIFSKSKSPVSSLRRGGNELGSNRINSIIHERPKSIGENPTSRYRDCSIKSDSKSYDFRTYHTYTEKASSKIARISTISLLPGHNGPTSQAGRRMMRSSTLNLR